MRVTLLVCLHIFVLSVLGLLVMQNLFAQVTGSIGGYVRDASGAAVVNATVTIVSEAQQLQRTAHADETGFYNLVAVPPGVYQITVEAAGFEKQLQSGVQLTAAQSLRLDVQLAVGKVQSEVTVASTATLVNTTNQTLSALIDDRRVVDLPLNGRNVVSLARILPGLMELKAPQEMAQTRDGPTLAFNGGRSGSTLFTLDGATFMHYGRTTGLNMPPPDAVQEVDIKTHNFTADYGNISGAQVTVVSKSGTNKLHGAAWEFLRNDVLNARSFFQATVPKQRQNQAGFAAGGPVRKNKLFVFGSYQRLWDRVQVGSNQDNLPTTAQRSGDFSATSVKLTSPIDPLTGKGITDPKTGAPCVAGNVISAGCIDPAATTILSKYARQTGLVTFQPPAPRDNYTWMTRVDFLQSPKHTLYGHFFRDHYDTALPTQTAADVPGYAPAEQRTDVWAGSLTSTYTFSPTFVTETMVSNLHAYSWGGTLESVVMPPRNLGINIDEGLFHQGASFSVAGRFSLTWGSPNKHRYNIFQLRNSTYKIMGRHTFKWGYEGNYVRWFLASNGNPRGFGFTGTRSGDATADFLLGAFDSFSIYNGPSNSAPIEWRHEFFVQDEYKVNQRLTLNLGLRYEPYLPWNKRNHLWTQFRVGTQSVVKPDSPPGVLFNGDPGVLDALVNPDLNNFAPRFGFAYDVFGNGKTSVRGGYGFFYEQISATNVGQSQAPWWVTQNLYGGFMDDPFKSVGQAPLPFPTDATGNFGCTKTTSWPGLACSVVPLPAMIVYQDPNLRTPYIQSVNLTIQRQITSNLMVEAGYVGKFGIKLDVLDFFDPAIMINSPKDGKPPSAQNVNERQLIPETRGIIAPTSNLQHSDKRSWFHSFQTSINKRFSRGFSVIGTYALSKNIDNMQGVDTSGNTKVGTPLNWNQIRGRSQLDRWHVITASWVWDLPYHPHNRLINGAIGGWTLTGIHTIQSGAPVNIVMGTDVAIDGTANSGAQPSLLQPGATMASIQRDHTSRNDFITQFFNTAAFVPTKNIPLGTYGNFGRNMLTGPALVNHDISLLKEFKLRESGLKFQMRVETFNSFNDVNFSNPNGSVVSGSFGKITSAAAGRVAQIAAKVLW